MNESNESASDRNCQQINPNEDATFVAAAVVVVAALEDTANVRDVSDVVLVMGAPDIPLIDPVELSALRVVGEALSKAVEGCVSVAAALANEA